MQNKQARTTFSRGQKLAVPVFIVILVLGSMIFTWHFMLVLLTALMSLLYFFDMLFNLFLVLTSLAHNSEFRVEESAVSSRKNWPTYTIFCPLYKEISVLPQFIEAMKNLDYPKDKLCIMLLLEEDDTETITAAQNMGLGPEVKIIVVPDSQPKTKPKACNYGLEQADTDYVVIFDAEDIPQPDQLKKAVVAFENAPEEIICLQAKLSFYNTYQNLLTRLFTAEYALWFNLTLVGLQNIKGPVPLGGTSNHFKTKPLKELNGWDPYNVTEDCDLGIRIYKQGYRTGILDSVTMEEANSKFGNWLRQRSRWIKGYMQTFLVHTRNPRQIQKHPLDLHIFTFYLVVGGKVLSMLINPFLWIITILYFVARPIIGPTIESLYPTAIFYIAVTTLCIGNFFYLYYFLLGSSHQGHWRLIKYLPLVPLYWLMMSLAACYGLYQLILKPHYWEKTVHGLHLKASQP